jgi:hypothetical protein
LFNIPQEVLREVLCTWLYIDSLAKFNTALCSRNIRKQVWQNGISSAGIFRGSTIEQRYLDRKHRLSPMLRWATYNRLRLNGLVLLNATDMYLASNLLLGAHIEWIEYEDHNSTSIDHFELGNTVLRSCPNLVRLHLSTRVDDSWMIAVTTHCPLLQHVDFPSYGMETSDETFLWFCKGCTLLKHLTMEYVYGVTDEGFVAGIVNLPHLQYLKHSPGEALQMEALGDIGRACPHLSTFTTLLNSEEAVLHYAHCFPRLVSLSPYAFPDTSVREVLTLSGYYKVLRVCPHITELEIPRHLPLDDAEAILRVHSQLTALIVDINLSHRILEIVTQYRPQLRQLTIRSYDTSPEAAAVLDMHLYDLLSACQQMQTLVFIHYGTMTARGLVACAERCPSLRNVQVFFPGNHLDVSSLRKVSQLVPRLSITASTFSVPKYVSCR